MTSQFRLIGARERSTAPQALSLLRPGAAELFALYDRALVEPEDDDRSKVRPIAPLWGRRSAEGSTVDTLDWLVEQGCQALCTCLPDLEIVGTNVHLLPPPEPTRYEQLTFGRFGAKEAWQREKLEKTGTLCMAHNYEWSDAMREVRLALGGLKPVRHLAAVYLSEDLQRLEDWRSKPPGRLLLVEIPHVLTVLDALLLSDGTGHDGDDVAIYRGANSTGKYVEDQLQLVGMESTEEEINHLLARQIITGDLDQGCALDAVIGRTDIFIRPGTDADDAPLVLQARAAGAAIASPIPNHVIRGHSGVAARPTARTSIDYGQDRGE